MHKPFDVSKLLETALDEKSEDTPDTFGQGPNRRSLSKRVLNEGASSDISQGSGDNQPSDPQEAEPDYVNHPPHYTKHPSGVECITITEWMNFNLGNAMKYIWRSNEKGSTITDLEKARWYVEREIDRLRRLMK